MGLLSWISEQREKVILGPAYEHLDPDEDVVQWVRVRQLGGKREGFLFVTDRRIIVTWTGRRDGHQVARWSELEAWGIDAGAERGPVVAVEGNGAAFVVQMPVPTHATASEVAAMLGRIASLAPPPRRSPQAAPPASGRWSTRAPERVSKSRKTPAEITRRVAVTVLGVAMVLGGMLISPVPGPWSLPIVLAGLAVLAGEYDWAKDLLQWVRRKYRQAAEEMRRRRTAGRR